LISMWWVSIVAFEMRNISGSNKMQLRPALSYGLQFSLWKFYYSTTTMFWNGYPLPLQSMKVL
jgi:hypothetical protein